MPPFRQYGCLRLLLLCLMLDPLVGPKKLVYADEATEFRQHYEQAVRLYEAGKYQDSLTEFQAAYSIKQLPRLLLNLGQVHRRLGHAKDALGYYEYYLRVEPNPEPKLKADLDRYIAQARVMLEAAEKVRRESAAAAAAKKQSQRPSSPPAHGARDSSASPPPLPSASQAPPSAGTAQAEEPADRRQEARVPLLPEATPPADERHSRRPVYKRAWFWGVMGAAGAVVIGAVVTGIVLGTQRGPGVPGDIEIHNWSLGVRP